MIFAPWLISWSAHALAADASLPWVSQVLITTLRPFTPFLLTFLTSSCAAASAGPSNGPIAPVLSCAQPMTIGPLAAECVRAAAPAARRLAPVVQVHAGDELRVARDLLEQPGRVPEVPDVELDPDGVAADLLEELCGIAERVQDRPALDPLQLERLDGQPQVETVR